MRPKIVIAVVLAGLAGLAVILLLKPAASRPETAMTPVVEPALTLPKAAVVVPQLTPSTNVAAVAIPSQPKKPAPIVTGEVTDKPNAESVQAQIDRLVDLQSNDDDASLQAILKELTNPNKEIRHEAVEATIQFGGHTAVPVLKDLAARTTDPDEKKELLDAAEFLALPTLSEARAQKKLENSQGIAAPR